MMEDLRRSIEDCDWKSALFHCDQIIKDDPNNIDAYSLKAFVFLIRRKYSELEQFCSNLPEDLAKNNTILYLRCVGLKNTRDFQKILGILGSDSQSEMPIEAILSSSEVDQCQDLKEIRDAALFESNRSESAVSIKSSVGDPSDPFYPETITKSIISAMTLREPSQLHCYTLVEMPEIEQNPLLLTACGCQRILLSQPESGQALLIKATECDPDCEIAWLCLIHFLMTKYEWEQSLSALRKVQRRFPQSDNVAMFAISLHLKVGNSSLAWQWINKFDKPNIFVRHERAVAFLMDGNAGEAQKEFEKVIAESDDRQILAAASMNLGHCLRKLGQIKEAIGKYEGAISYGASSSEALASIGFCHHMLGDIDKAILYYNRSLSVDSIHSFATKMLEIILQGKTI